MTTRDVAQSELTWIDNDNEDLMELEMDDDEVYFDGNEPEDADEELGDPAPHYQAFSARRRIEIAREDKWLKSAMADFEDYDSYETPNRWYAEEVSF